MVQQWFSQTEKNDWEDTFCVFVARQPIVDDRQQTIGYDLRFRDSWESRVPPPGSDALRDVIDVSITYGLQSLVGNKVPFIECSNEAVLQGLPTLLPSFTVLQIKDQVPISDALVESCGRLHGSGHSLALTHYESFRSVERLVPFLSYLKIDTSQVSILEQHPLCNKLAKFGIEIVLDGVATDVQMRDGLSKGVRLFQGPLFAEPKVLARVALSSVRKRIRFLHELTQPGLDFDRIVNRLKEEPALSVRLLRLVNSPALAITEPVTSLKMALLLVGEERFCKLARTVLTTELCGQNRPETHLTILRKARFCELMAFTFGLDPEVSYLFGMLSVVLPMLSLSASATLDIVKLPEDVISALKGTNNAYRRILRCSDSYDKGDWTQFLVDLSAIGGAGDVVVRHCIAAQRWADNVFRTM